ncbi:MAG: serine protease [Candidatus Doudnabacteria bacterium]|nr:serine protease [Candidatus Doudnabacteria bacterium]
MRRHTIRFDSLYSARNRCVEVCGSLSGTGVIVETGLVFTNYHLIENGDDSSILVDGECVEQVIYFDFALDFAALKVVTKEVKPIAIQTKCWANQPVFYVGNPGEKVKAIQLGRIKSCKTGQIEVVIDCEQGFSGSGLYNLRGQLIGLTDSFDDEPAKNSGRNGYAIPGRNLADYLSFCRKKIARDQLLTG